MVKVSLIEDNPWVIRAFATKLTRDPGSYKELLEQTRKMGVERCKEYATRIYKAFEHDIVLEFGDRAIVLDKISRMSALFTWRNISALNEVYTAGLEKSLRLIKPPFDCIDSTSEQLYNMGLEPYQKAVEKVPAEDARYMLPEGVLTTVVLSFPRGTERYFAKIANSYKWPLKEHDELREGIQTLVKNELDILPDEEPLSEWKMKEDGDWKDEISICENPHSTGINKTLDGSFSMYAQLVRMRLGLTQIESPERSATRSKYVIPSSFDSSSENAYREIAAKATEIQLSHLKQNDSNFVYYMLLGQKAKGLFHVFGKTSNHVGNARSCGSAQWEIRTNVGIELAKLLSIGPKCMTERKCTEPPKDPPCPIKKEWPKLSTNEAVEKLRVPSRDFTVES